MTRIDREKIQIAFRKLRKIGYFTRMNFMCCQNCAWHTIPKEKANKVVFFHKQDNEAFDTKCKKNFQRNLYLAWSGDSKEICKVLREFKLEVVEPVDENERILVKSGWENQENYW